MSVYRPFFSVHYFFIFAHCSVSRAFIEFVSICWYIVLLEICIALASSLNCSKVSKMLKFRVFWDVLPCSQIDISEDSELHTHRHENLKSHTPKCCLHSTSSHSLNAYFEECHFYCQ
jgi:hypothetical protein